MNTHEYTSDWVFNNDKDNMANVSVDVAQLQNSSWVTNMSAINSFTDYAIRSEITANIRIDSAGIDMQPGTDIVIGGRSLMKTLDTITERLAILEPNNKLESEWAELKQLGERYRAMEQDLLEKAKMWNTLKARQHNNDRK